MCVEAWDVFRRCCGKGVSISTLLGSRVKEENGPAVTSRGQVGVTGNRKGHGQRGREKDRPMGESRGTQLEENSRHMDMSRERVDVCLVLWASGLGFCRSSQTRREETG